jgi:putative protein-disulfide isomerase
MPPRLIYVMDPMCSWCWGFAPVVEAVRARAPELPWHYVAGGLRPGGRAGLDDRACEALAEHWSAAAGASGQCFGQPQDLPDTFIFDTEPACRAMLVARYLDPNRVGVLVEGIQRAFYLSTRDVSKVSLLIELAEEAGYDRTSFAEAYDAETSRAAVAADFSWTRDLGIAGFPTLLAQRDGLLALLANGFQTPEVVLPLVDRWLTAGQQVP